MKKTNKGFSLVELIVVIAIMAIIAAVAIPVYNIYIENSQKKADSALLVEIITSIQKTAQDMKIDEPAQMSSEGIKMPLGFIIITQNGTTVEQGSKTDIDQMLKNAYGESYTTELKLKSDVWKSTVPTFYKDADQIYEKLEDSAALIALASSAGLGDDLFGANIDSKEDFVVGLANEVTKAELTEDKFVEHWLAVGAASESKAMTDVGFGLNGRQNYSAVRSAYNASFTSYMKQNGHDSGHAEKIDNYMSHVAGGKGTLASIVGISGIPQVICRNAFIQQEAEKNWGTYKTDSYHLPSEVKNCSECRRLYEQYVTTDVEICEENARAFYQTMKALSSSSDKALASGDFFGYYRNTLQDAANMYDALAQKIPSTGSCAVITVYSINGVISADIVPVEADSRK